MIGSMVCCCIFSSMRSTSSPPRWMRLRIGGYRRMATPEFHWLNTMLGNVKNSLRDSDLQPSGEHLPRYLGEFCYRFNRPFDLAAMLPRLGWAAVRTPPIPHRLLVLAEPC